MTHFEEDRMQQNIDATKIEPHRYDAFISYSHKADSELARVLQVRLERWARPWFAARTAKLFRDQVSLTATPHLWTTIAESLDNSKYLILLASTDSATSKWVPREICYWLTGGKCELQETLESEQVIKERVDRLMIVLTEGQIEWSHGDGDFDWSITTALPPVLRNLPWQPLWTDLRWARGMKAKQIEADERFTEPVLKLLSPIRGKTPQELLDANDKEQKRAVSLFRRLSIGLAIGFILAVSSGYVALKQRDLAVRRERDARHEQGAGWLARSEAAERRRDYLASKLMAMKAVNFSGYGGNGGKDQELLKPESEEFLAALRRIVSLPECNLIFTASLDLHRESSAAQCAFSDPGTQLIAVSANGASTTVDFPTGTIQHSQLTRQELDQLSRVMRFERSLHFQNGERRQIFPHLSLEVIIEGKRAFAEWRHIDDSSHVTKNEIPEESLWADENDFGLELIDLATSRSGNSVLATFQSDYAHAVVACDKKECSVIYESKGEMSYDSGVLRTVGRCLSHDETMIVVSETNAKDEGSNNLKLYRRNPAGNYSHWSDILVEGAAVRELAISASNRYLAGASGNLINVWDMSDGRMLLTLSGHDGTLRDIEFSQDERSLASVADDEMVLVWSLPLAKDEKVSMRGLSLRLCRDLFKAELPVANPNAVELDKVSCTSRSGDLRAEWETYMSASGLGDETRYATLKIIDSVVGTSIDTWAMVDAPKIDNLEFAADGRAVVVNQPDSDPLLFPISHPRRQIDYNRAYAPVKYVGEGIVFQRSSHSWREGRLPVPANLSSMQIVERAPEELIPEATKWYFDSRGMSAAAVK